MIDPDDFLDAVEAYEENRLAPAQRQLFKQQCQTDPALQAALTDYRAFRHSLEAVDVKRQLAAIHTKLEANGTLLTEPPQPFATTRPAWGLWRWVAAASVLLAVGVWLGWVRPARQQAVQMQAVFVAFYRPEPIMRGGTECSDNLAAIIGLYRSKEYLKVIQLADSQITDNGRDNACLLYYWGLCELALGRYDEAVYSLEVARRPASGPLRQRADWYLALAYLSNHDRAKARDALTQITRQPDHPFGPVARQALAELSK